MNNPFRKSTAPEVCIFDSELNLIVAEAAKWPGRETGGDLYGTFTHSGAPVVWFATGPGPGAKGYFAEFQQDTAFSTSWQQYLTQDFAVQYIGSWHSHHGLGLKHPSRGDVGAVQAYGQRHGRVRSIEIIVTIEGAKAEPVLHPYIYLDTRTGRYESADFRRLSGVSPLRTKLGQDPDSKRISVETLRLASDETSSNKFVSRTELFQPELDVIGMELKSLQRNGFRPEDIYPPDIRGDEIVVMLDLEAKVGRIILGFAIRLRETPHVMEVRVFQSIGGKSTKVNDLLDLAGIQVKDLVVGQDALLTIARSIANMPAEQLAGPAFRSTQKESL